MKRMRLFLAAAVALLALAGCPQPTDPVDTTVPVSFLVVESINGTLVGGVTVQAFDADGALAGTTTSVAGRATLRLEPDQTYSIVSTKTGQAQSRREGVYVDASAANEVTLVNQ
ncbi:MAG TPA: carboxypeptidase-like regulatory domain-containing protein, partial [Spirochaetales bacterium]|nr:carboxypeptidase-like regulatory domain-containing protein [Spirochaetales bacterium]